MNVIAEPIYVETEEEAERRKCKMFTNALMNLTPQSLAFSAKVNFPPAV